MTIVVGTDTYITEAAADTYWSNRNNSVWSAASTAEKEKALREATQYIGGAYNFIGDHKTGSVVLAWPRYNVFINTGNFKGVSYDSDTIPPQIEDACAELALEALSANLVTSKERGGLVKREKVDVIEVEYMDFAPSQKSYDFVSIILKPLLQGNSNVKGLVR